MVPGGELPSYPKQIRQCRFFQTSVSVGNNVVDLYARIHILSGARIAYTTSLAERVIGQEEIVSCSSVNFTSCRAWLAMK
jgi:hypothetical protein